MQVRVNRDPQAIALCFASALLATGCVNDPAPDAGPTVVATGRVARSMAGARFEDLVGLSGAAVCVLGMSEVCTMTAPDGAYRLEGVPGVSRVALTFESAGYGGALAAVVTDDRPLLLDMALTPADEITALDAMAGVARDPSLGAVAFIVIDTAGVEGVSADIEPAPHDGPFYTNDDRTVSLSRTATSTRGYGVALNVPVGAVRLILTHATRRCDEAVIGWSSEDGPGVEAPIVAGLETSLVVRCAP